MILTCPSCKTSFKVPEGAINAEGRKVRCASCAHVWHATLADVKAVPAPQPAQPRPNPPRPPQQPPQQAMPSPRPIPNAGPATVDQSNIPQTALQNSARPSAQAMPPVMPKDQAQAQTAAIRQAMLAEAGLDEDETSGHDDLLDDAPAPESAPVAQKTETNTETTMDNDMSGLGDLLDDANGFSDDLGAGLAAHLDDVPQDEDAGTGEGLTTADLMDKYLGSDDDDPIMQHRMKQKRDYERRRKLRRKFVRNFFLWTMLIAWLAAVGVFFFAPDVLKKYWPASQAIYDYMAKQNDTKALEKELKEELAKEGLTLSKAPSETKQELFIEKPKTEIVSQSDGEHLRIFGLLENKSKYAITLPELEGQIFDKSGVLIQQWRFKADGVTLGRGARTPYDSTSPILLPAGAQSVNVIFIWPGAEKKE